MASSSSNSSCSPSSSAVTIPIPGKSILKRPPPTQQSLFSRITRFLPTQNQTQSSPDEAKPLKRAHFILPQIATVYPISSANPPSTPNLKDEKRAIEDREAERRKRVVRGNSIGPGVNDTEEWWSLDKVESFYRECCAGCEEEPDPTISAAFKNAFSSNPRSVDFSGVQLTPTSAAILSDVFTIEWGLRKVVFRECDLDELTLKPILHSLLIPGTISFLSVASNRRLKTPAFRLIGAYVAKADSLQFLDLSQNPLDKKSIEYIVAALATAPTPGLVSLRLDDCSLRPGGLESLSRAVRTSSLRNISLRHNRINATGAVALALMIRDYPDVVPISSPNSSVSSNPLSPTSATHFPPYPHGSDSPSSSLSSSPASSVTSLPLSPASLSSTLSSTSTSSAHTAVPQHLPPPTRTGPLLPPPKHPVTNLQTTYTPYVPRARRGAPARNAVPNPLSATGQPVPIITSSSQGGITTRHSVGVNGVDAKQQQGQGRPQGRQGGNHAGPSAALLDKVRALDALPRLGALRTLDLKGNDLRTGITYIAQVLKRNRTLKVLNLSENKLDVTCLVAVAEALKYNSSLETLDLSKNPCSGPGLEGIQSLRTAFTLNTALKRLFLSSTSMTSAGAIALAEFLPESTSLLHLDLTMNDLGIAGVMALSSGLKANHTMRCLDLNIPPGDEEFARMCRDILNSCVRNTEDAEKIVRAENGGGGADGDGSGTSLRGGSGRGLGKGVWGMIEESELAKSIRKGEEKKIESDVVVRARACVAQLSSILSPSVPNSPSSAFLTPTFSAISKHNTPDPNPLAASVIASKAKAVIAELSTVIQETADPDRMEELLQINDELTDLVAKLPSSGRPTLTLQGLGLRWDVNGRALPVSGITKGMVNGNGEAMHDSPIGEDEEIKGDADESEAEEDTPTTPRIDKGKAKAEPEPVQHEKVLSPTFMIAEEEEDDDAPKFPPVEIDAEALEAMENLGATSPTDRSRSWVEEEGEVFRKGTVLLGPEEMEGEYAGEELRKELLEAMVERPPPRPLTDEFGLDLPSHSIPEHDVARDTPKSPKSPTTPTAEPAKPAKPPPRPYISRSRSSSSSIMSLVSPTVGSSPHTDILTPSLSRSPLSPTGSPGIPARPYVARSRSSSSVETL